VTSATGNLVVTEIAQRPLQQSMLNHNDCYCLDNCGQQGLFSKDLMIVNVRSLIYDLCLNVDDLHFSNLESSFLEKPYKFLFGRGRVQQKKKKAVA